MDADTTIVQLRSGDHFTVGDLSRRGSKPVRWTRFLYRLEQLHRAERVLELGTNAGISGTALALALPTDGHLWTLDVNLTDYSSAAFKRAGLIEAVTIVDGFFDDTLPDVLTDAEPVGLAFVDGNHHEEPTLRYFEQILPHLTDDALVVFDDVHWSLGMESAWRQLRRHPMVAWSVDLRSLGVVAIGR